MSQPKPSEAIIAKAQEAFQKRIAGRNLPEWKKGDLLLMEMIMALMNHIDENSP